VKDLKHKEYRRICPGAERAVLFIHGIAGTPRHFDDFVALTPDNVSVYNMLLEGHGKGVRDFSRASMSAWESQVHAAVTELLKTHKYLYIAAHSMGTLFAISEAIGEARVKKLFLLAVPIKLSLKAAMVKNALKVCFNKVEGDAHAQAAKNCCGVEISKNPLLYLGWIPRYLELFSKISRTRKLMGRLSTETCVFQSARDEMVSLSSARYLGVNPGVRVNVLENSSHYYYEKEDYQILLAAFTAFIQ